MADPATEAGVPVLRLLPTFELSWTSTSRPMPSRAQRLLALLALAGRPLQRTVIAARLWPDVVNSRANASLRATLWSLPRENGGPVIVDGNRLALDPRITLDVTQARESAMIIIDGAYSDDLADRAVALLTEDLLPDWPDEWLTLEQDAFRQLRLHALDMLCIQLAEVGRFARAVMVGLASVASEPSRESAHRALMGAHLHEGNRMEALRVYHNYLAMAREEMGIGPSPLLESLFHAALQDTVHHDHVTSG